MDQMVIIVASVHVVGLSLGPYSNIYCAVPHLHYYRSQKPRRIYLDKLLNRGRPSLSNKNLQDLQGIARELDISIAVPLANGKAKKKTKKELVELIRAAWVKADTTNELQGDVGAALGAVAAGENTGASGSGASSSSNGFDPAVDGDTGQLTGMSECTSQQIWLGTNYDTFYDSLQDMAPTCDKFFVCNKSEGDYHDNFDSLMSFKWWVALEITWPYFLQHLQRLKMVYPAMFLDEFFRKPVSDFYNLQDGTCLRDCYVEQDNAPYNCGVEYQLASKTTSDLADLLRDKLSVTSISYQHLRRDGTVEDIVSNVEVPQKGNKWDKHGEGPSLFDIRSATLKIMQARCPSSLQPPFFYVMNRDSRQRGFAMGVTHSAPYTSPICPIEWKWQDGKGYVGKAENQFAGRSPADVVILLRRKWYEAVQTLKKGVDSLASPVQPRKWIDHCHHEMDRRIADIKVSFPKCPLRGGIHDLVGGPSTEAERIQWRKNAGMDRVLVRRADTEELDGDMNGAALDEQEDFNEADEEDALAEEEREHCDDYDSDQSDQY
jgi:hypothetical protein